MVLSHKYEWSPLIKGHTDGLGNGVKISSRLPIKILPYLDKTLYLTLRRPQLSSFESVSIRRDPTYPSLFVILGEGNSVSKRITPLCRSTSFLTIKRVLAS